MIAIAWDIACNIHKSFVDFFGQKKLIGYS